jgi:hypothetical protein
MGAKRHVPATIISNSFISDLLVLFNNSLNREILSALTRQTQPPLSLQNNTAGVREREEANRTREAGNLDEVQAAASFALLSTIISQPQLFFTPPRHRPQRLVSLSVLGSVL